MQLSAHKQDINMQTKVMKTYEAGAHTGTRCLGVNPTKLSSVLSGISWRQCGKALGKRKDFLPSR